MSDFTALIAGWETLYLLIGTAAATLMGLLFVAVSINVEKIRWDSRQDLRNFGALTFNDFFYVLLISVLFLTPRLGWLTMGSLLLLLALADLTNSILQWRRASRTKSNAKDGGLSARFGFSIVCLAVLVLLSLAIMFQVQAALYGVLIIAICLLGTAAVNAWSLLIRIDQKAENL